ncbi:MAG: hypothetical protein ABI729_08675, partial [Chitinophagales bacterium]
HYYHLICDDKESIHAAYHSVMQKNNFLTALQESLEKDRQLERTTEGIHRDEFEFYLNSQPVKKFGSQGQKKTFLMSLKFAQWALIKSERDKTPILLLDDLFDKIDEQRAEKILDMIVKDSFGQVFITDTRAERWLVSKNEKIKEYRHFRIESGKVLSTE